MKFAAWNAETDTLAIHNGEPHYGDLLKSWNFQPALKMHTDDFKIVAMKPDGWSVVSPK
jgi:hypothetical protein